MFPRVTHPSATPVLLRAFDLHVLSLPPAFVLSQDQTLKLILRSPIPTGHFQQGPAAPLHLDEFQTHPLLRKKRESPPPGGPPRPSQKRDEFLKRDRQRSLKRTRSPGPARLTPNKTRRPRPARTTPPTSLFLPMQLSNSESLASGLSPRNLTPKPSL